MQCQVLGLLGEPDRYAVSGERFEHGGAAVGGDFAARVAVHGDRGTGMAELVGDLAGAEAPGVEDAGGGGK